MSRAAGPTGPSYHVPSYEPMSPFLGHAAAAAAAAAAAGGGEEDEYVVGRLTLEKEALEEELKEAMDVQLNALVQLEVAAYRERDPGGAAPSIPSYCTGPHSPPPPLWPAHAVPASGRVFGPGFTIYVRVSVAAALWP